MTSRSSVPLRRSARLPGFDYSRCGTYFVTICSHRPQNTFGAVVHGKMTVNRLGALVQRHWEKLPAHFSHLELGPFVLMPNHLHGILMLVGDAGTASRAPTAERFGLPVPGSVPTIVRSFKSGVTREARRLGLGGDSPIWQRGYFEHVVRHEKALDRICEYIAGNPQRWHLDRENAAREGRDGFDEWLDSFKRRPKDDR